MLVLYKCSQILFLITLYMVPKQHKAFGNTCMWTFVCIHKREHAKLSIHELNTRKPAHSYIRVLYFDFVYIQRHESKIYLIKHIMHALFVRA
jgi:hypothetical protein